MRTNIVIDDKLMDATLKATGIKTKREAFEEGLRTLLRLRQQTDLRKLRGKYEWEGDALHTLSMRMPVLLIGRHPKTVRPRRAFATPAPAARRGRLGSVCAARR
jgi:Arc/MetJ family transcription regulator